MYIASSSTTVKFHSFPDGDLVYNYQPGSKVDGSIKDISWAKDGTWLSLVPKSGQAEIISLKNQLKLLHTVVGVEEPSCTAFQNLTKKFIAFGTKNGQVLVYDTKTRSIKNRFPRASSLISHVEFTARDTHIVAGCLNGEILLYSNINYGLSATYKIPKSESVSTLKTHPMKRNYIVGGSNEGVVAVWDTNVNKSKICMESHKAPVTDVVFSPINSNLVISTGADRQFCCYDILSNKCISIVPVDNNMVAVDFSPDGTHIAMASQKGNICLYDSRMILEPVLIFEAHKSAIKKVIFQKQEVGTSYNNMSDEKGIFQPRVEQDQVDVTTNESFGEFLKKSNHMQDVVDCESRTTSNQADSFMIAMGLGNGPTMDSMKSENNLALSKVLGEGDSKWNDTQQTENELLNSGLNIPEREKISLYERRCSRVNQISTSTPNCPLVIESKIDAIMSPIVKPEFYDKSEPTMVPIDQLKKITEDIVRKEMSELSNDVKYQFTSNITQIRRMYLDMQMSIVKEFIKMENMMNALREDMASNSPLPESYLLEENLRLKKQIALLEAELASKSEYSNGNQ